MAKQVFKTNLRSAGKKRVPDLRGLNKKHLELLARISELLKKSKRPGQSWIFDWFNVELRLLENYKRLRSWYGNDRVELMSDKVLLDGRPVVNKFKGKEAIKLFMERGT